MTKKNKGKNLRTQGSDRKKRTELYLDLSVATLPLDGCKTKVYLLFIFQFVSLNLTQFETVNTTL